MSTHEAAPSIDNRWPAALWLVQRSPQLTAMCRRIGVLRYSGRGAAQAVESVDPDKVAQVVFDSDAHAAAWDVYEANHPYPAAGRDAMSDDDEDRAYSAWLADGPSPNAGVAAFGVMSSGEKALLRLLATLGRPTGPDDRWESPVRRAGWSIGDLHSLDAAGWAVVRDWLRLIAAAAPNPTERPQRPERPERKGDV